MTLKETKTWRKWSKKLDEDPIEDLDQLTGVIGYIQKNITPRTSHNALLVNVNAALAAASGSGSGGQPVHYIHDHEHHADRSCSSHSSLHRSPTTAINNVIEGGDLDDISLDRDHAEVVHHTITLGTVDILGISAIGNPKEFPGMGTLESLSHRPFYMISPSRDSY